MRKKPSCVGALASDRPIVVAGAGAIGCFVGGMLAAAGREVIFLGRARTGETLARQGLHLTDFAGLDVRVRSPEATDAPKVLAKAGLVLVAVKTGDTQAMAAEIARFSPSDTLVVSLQNGLDAVGLLREALPGRDVRAGMVPFNVVSLSPGQFHRASSGDIVLEAGPADLGEKLSVPHLAVTESAQIEAVQWGKLVINLNNAVNALSGLTLHEQLLNRDWRKVMAAQMSEALDILRRSGIKTRSTTPVPLALVPMILRLPTPMFRRIAAQMLTIDPSARTSMAHDVMAGKQTEIASLQGRIVDLALAQNRQAPISARIAEMIEGLDHPPRRYSPNDLFSG